MKQAHTERLWLEFPADLPAFEARFGTEQACRDYLMVCRWNDQPTCDKCGHDKVWHERGGRLFECAKCHHHMSLTSGTLLHGTRKPLKIWFRAIWEVCVHRPGISAKDLQRIMGFGSYETAWVWLHKIREGLVTPDRSKLAGTAQLDEAFIGGKGTEKAMIIVAAEEAGRIRLIHAPGNHEAAIKHVAERFLETDTHVKTDGQPAYNEKSLGSRAHDVKVQSKDEKSKDDHEQLCHWTISNAKRWLLGTYHGAVSDKHLQSYLHEFEFRQNRHNTKGVGRLVARALENMVRHAPMGMRELVDNTEEFRYFQKISY